MTKKANLVGTNVQKKREVSVQIIDNENSVLLLVTI
jgi:hypothetical protein